MAELLFELGSEELPARFVGPALEDIVKNFSEQCTALNIKFGAIRTFGTPRRLAILVTVAEKTDDVMKEVQGPSVKAAFEADGKTPRTPATKFAESVKLSVDQLKRVTTPKGEYLTATVEEKGKRVFDLLPEVLNVCMRKINFAKQMRWGDVEQTFGRPLQWIVALLGSEVIPLTFSDVKSGRITKGHRFLSPQPITLNAPADYETALEKANVVADIEKRRKLMIERIAAAAKTAGGTVLEDEALVDQVVNLVELPNPVVGSFESRHLELPPEVLVQEMKSHQRYFSLLDDKKKLLPKFIAVSNTPVKDVALSVVGYERVLRARLTDGRFFFDEDRRSKLEDRLPKLARRSWIDRLGSMAEKTERIKTLASWLAKQVGQGAITATVERAATLCKADLNTGMVGEFPELQGVMGREYALHDKEPKEVALAIFEHYLPRGAGDGLPTQDAGAIIGLADRLDSLAGLFGIGKRPTGAKDDFALRRAAITFIRIATARGYRFSLAAAIDKALEQLAPKLADVKPKAGEPPVREQLLEFFRGRLESTWRENFRPDVVEAVLSAGFDDLTAAQLRLNAISTYLTRPDFAALAATFKRVANIVDKEGKDVPKGQVDAGSLTEDAEKVLNTEVSEVRDAVLASVRSDDYAGAMSRVVPLKPFVDTFFDKVRVVPQGEKLPVANRVHLLRGIRDLFGAIIDFSKIQAETEK
ncbi:MAG: glycine--tRNA ligase subunit beta [Archangium sp.]|nr:glycine--tRNA ligase subunit beta [Archangium sp.]